MNVVPPRLEHVAIDDGYSFFKALTRTHAARIPTAFTVNPHTKVAVLGRQENGESLYEIEGLTYAVGANVASHDTRFEEFPYHPANLAVAMDAMRRVVEPGAAVHVIAGVPLNRFYLPSGEINAEVSRRKTLAWGRPVRAASGRALPRICQVTVISEAVAAWFDFVISDKFVAQEHLINDFMAVVDLGGRTTNIAVFQEGSINLALSGTIDRGVLDIQKRVAALLAGKYPETQFPRQFLIEAVQSGKAKFGTGSLDISEEVLAERRSLVAEVDIFMRTQFGAHLPLMKRVLFVGGGAQALQGELKERFPNALFANDPQMANVRGMLKFAVTVPADEPTVVNG